MTFHEPLTNNVALLQSIVVSRPMPSMCVSPSPRALAVGIPNTGTTKHAATAQYAAVRTIVAPLFARTPTGKAYVPQSPRGIS
jgi:hypothetical protein